MAKLRNLSRVAQMLLQQHLQEQTRRGLQEDRLAAQEQQRRMGLESTFAQRAIDKPEEADDLISQASKMGINIAGLRPSNQRLEEPIYNDIQKDPYNADEGQIIRRLKTLERPGRDLTSPVLGSMETQPEGENLPATQFQPAQRPNIQSLLAARQQGIAEKEAGVKRAIEQAGNTKFAENYGGASGTAAAKHDYADQVAADERAAFEAMTPLEVSRSGQTSTATNQAQQDVLNNPRNIAGATRRAGSIAGAEASARQAAEWLDPRVTAAKLDFENKKRIAELAQVGAKIEAEDLAKRAVAVKGLMPIYMQYKQLANVVTNSWAGAGSAVSGGAINAVGHLPAIGEFLASTLEAGHGALAAIGDEKLAKQINELNRLTDTLAQGMANAVLGNRGQTTENDRRTAKGLLISSFTNAETAADMMAITDKMFAVLPSVAASMPNAAPADVFNAVETQIKHGDTAAPTVPQAPVSSPVGNPQAPLRPNLMRRLGG